MPGLRPGGEGPRFPGRQRLPLAPAGRYKTPHALGRGPSLRRAGVPARPHLAMSPRAPRSSLPALLALLAALLPGPGGATLTVFPQEATILRGSSLEVNCSDSCSSLGLETPLSKQEVAHGATWKTFLLSDVQEDSGPICFSNCGKQDSQRVSITVYWFPETVTLASLPSWQPVGQNFTLRCEVAGGAPRSNLTAVLLRGDEELSRQPVPGVPADVVEVTATVQARREDHGANFSCRTELDLRPVGLGLFENSSVPRQLQTFVLPETLPSLEAPTLVEVGTEWRVACTLDGLFPVSEAGVELVLGDVQLPTMTTYHEDFISARALVEAAEEGEQQLKCTLTLGTEVRQHSKTLRFYSFRTPNLTLNPPEVTEGTSVTVECEAQPGTLVTLNGVSYGNRSAQRTFNASAEDHGRAFSCSAQLEVAGQWLQKNQTRRLNVLYGPFLDPSDCPRNWTLDEGSHQTLRCQPRGNPNPQLECLRKEDKSPLPIGDLRPVKEDIQGTYVCRASSSQGMITTEVVLTVISKPRNHVPIIITLTVLAFLATVATIAYWVNRQRKIREYKLQKAQNGAALKQKLAATPP
ncbi:intercellular adhesion molecule 1 [Sorex fumeus]|uniref:intercellular adhesion molecule 1 n=1 Tax=Sorex fumeus TaxID=62283 RepID=UPI0024AD3786|nr:intercellular adhesion molecule 1 [Sorex fumeus]